MSTPTPEPRRHDVPAQDNPPSPLFRTEVLAAHDSQWAGAIRLSQTMSHWTVAAVALLLGVGVVAFVGLGSYTRKMQVAGIVAPANGNIAVSGLNGASDGAGARLEVHLYAPAGAVGFVRLGQPVVVRYRAFPYQKFGLYSGNVSAVGKTPLGPGELPGTIAAGARGAGNEGLYRVQVAMARQSVAVHGHDQPLAAGMTLEADLLLDRRRIWEWIVEP
jgi:hypothetical protein